MVSRVTLKKTPKGTLRAPQPLIQLPYILAQPYILLLVVLLVMLLVMLLVALLVMLLIMLLVGYGEFISAYIYIYVH